MPPLRTQRLVTQCCVLNGTIYLGSILGWQLLLQPALRWLLGATVQPAWGWLPMALLTRGLELLVQAVWLFPAYIVMLIVNAVWCAALASHPTRLYRLLWAQTQCACAALRWLMTAR